MSPFFFLAVPSNIDAHGFAGARFFPATLSTDDPFAASEMSLPTFIAIRQPGDPPVKTYDISTDISLLLFPNTALTIGDGYLIQKAAHNAAMTGFDNASANILYEFFENDPHETICSLGLTWEIGGTGRHALGADSFSTLTPTFYFGKGFGDLPQSTPFLRPLALTGEIGLAIPTRAGNRNVTLDPATGNRIVSTDPNPNILVWGFALEYSLIYLQEQVRDVGLKAPFSHLIPLVEFALQTPVNRNVSGPTGTINPGIIWSVKYYQLGVEAVIPVNNRTGHNAGVIAQIHFYLDDVLPRIFGKPLFGG